MEEETMRKRLLFSLVASYFVGLAMHAQALPAVQNTSGVRLVVADENTDPTLRVILPGHRDSDKTIEVVSLLVGYKVTLKLTVDSTYKQDTPIQIEVTGDAGLFQRVGADSCKDIGIFAPNPDSLNTPVPNNP